MSESEKVSKWTERALRHTLSESSVDKLASLKDGSRNTSALYSRSVANTAAGGFWRSGDKSVYAAVMDLSKTHRESHKTSTSLYDDNSRSSDSFEQGGLNEIVTSEEYAASLVPEKTERQNQLHTEVENNMGVPEINKSQAKSEYPGYLPVKMAGADKDTYRDFEADSHGNFNLGFVDDDGVSLSSSDISPQQGTPPTAPGVSRSSIDYGKARQKVKRRRPDAGLKSKLIPKRFRSRDQEPNEVEEDRSFYDADDEDNHVDRQQVLNDSSHHADNPIIDTVVETTSGTDSTTTGASQRSPEEPLNQEKSSGGTFNVEDTNESAKETNLSDENHSDFDVKLAALNGSSLNGASKGVSVTKVTAGIENVPHVLSRLGSSERSEDENSEIGIYDDADIAAVLDCSDNEEIEEVEAEDGAVVGEEKIDANEREDGGDDDKKKQIEDMEDLSSMDIKTRIGSNGLEWNVDSERHTLNAPVVLSNRPEVSVNETEGLRTESQIYTTHTVHSKPEPSWSLKSTAGITMPEQISSARNRHRATAAGASVETETKGHPMLKYGDPFPFVEEEHKLESFHDPDTKGFTAIHTVDARSPEVTPTKFEFPSPPSVIDDLPLPSASSDGTDSLAGSTPPPLPSSPPPPMDFHSPELNATVDLDEELYATTDAPVK